MSRYAVKCYCVTETLLKKKKIDHIHVRLDNNDIYNIQMFFHNVYF